MRDTMPNLLETQYVEAPAAPELRLSDYLVTVLENWRMFGAI
jgi:tyrosine-protein kinase Etk/Wzc